MAVAIGGAGTIVAAAAQTISPAYPASIAAENGLLLVRTAKPDTTVLVTPDGWTLLDEQAGGAGVFGNDTGPCKIAVYWREANGTETGTVACTTNVGTFDIQQAVINRYTKANGTIWDVTAGGGVDSVAGTDWTVTSDVPLGVEAGDVIQVALTWPTDSARTWSAEAATASGATIGALSVPMVAAATGLGADMATRVHAFEVTAGSSSVGPTYVGTVNSATNVTGPTTMVRLREISAGGSVDGELDATLPAFTADAAGSARTSASVAVPLPAVATDSTGAARTAAVVAAHLGPVMVTVTGSARSVGILDVTLPAAAIDLGEAPEAVMPGTHTAGTSHPALTPGLTRPTLTANTNRG